MKQQKSPSPARFWAASRIAISLGILMFDLIGVCLYREPGIRQTASLADSSGEPPYAASTTFPGGLHKPVLALELARSVADVREILGDEATAQGQARREWQRKMLKGDYQFFIPIYWALLVGFSLLLTRRRFQGAMRVGVTAAAFATGAAVCDLLENAGMNAVLNAPLAETSEQMVAYIRLPSLFKWAMVFITIGLLAGLFLRRKDWMNGLGGVCLLIAAVGMSGFTFRYPPAIELAFTIMPVALLLLILVPLIFRRRFMAQF